MEQLSYAALRAAGYDGYLLENAPEKVLQFGEGNFLRAFADYWFDLANERAGWNGKCVVVVPRPSGAKNAKAINDQQGLYTLCLRGCENGARTETKRVISSVSRCLNPYDPGGFEAMLQAAASPELEIIVSNTTEAGIAYDPACRLTDRPASSFPGKLAQALYARWKAGQKGPVILACELIDDNGRVLRDCVEKYIDQWGLGEDFRKYVREDCAFCGTLVDRIVPGRVRDPDERARVEAENGYRDGLLTVAEVFGLWVIEGDAGLSDRLPFRRAGLDDRVFVVPDMAPYKKRKVRILNGAHTGFAPGAFLAGFDIVRDCVRDEAILGFMNRMLLDEVVPLLPLDRDDCTRFAAAVKDRFDNPFIDHALLSICLNSTAKWRARNLPSLEAYVGRNGALPRCLVMSFALLAAFYTSGVQALTDEGLLCRRPKGENYVISDDRAALEFFYAHRGDSPRALMHALMADAELWGRDLTEISGFEEAAAEDLAYIRTNGAKAAFESCLK